jgi:hypothetical protein
MQLPRLSVSELSGETRSSVEQESPDERGGGRRLRGKCVCTNSFGPPISNAIFLVPRKSSPAKITYSSRIRILRLSRCPSTSVQLSRHGLGKKIVWKKPWSIQKYETDVARYIATKVVGREGTPEFVVIERYASSQFGVCMRSNAALGESPL